MLQLVRRVGLSTGMMRRCEMRAFTTPSVSQNEYEEAAEESLNRLADYFDSFQDTYSVSQQYDVNHAMGVLTVAVGNGKGTYVINKQSPNKQIWLSSPVSGPKRYDLIKNSWIYTHDEEALHTLLTREFRKHMGDDKIDFSKHI